MSTAQELVKYCSTIHMKTLLPDVLVIDELEYYFGQLTVSYLLLGKELNEPNH